MNYKNIFFTLEDGRKINLKHVSSISLDYKRDKVIFKFDYAINPIFKKGTELTYDDSDDVDPTKSHNMRMISTGYVYTYGIQSVLDNIVKVPYFNDNFINKQLDRDDHDDLGFINLENVTSVKFEYDKNKVIFNFSNSVTFYDKFEKTNNLVSEFLYLNFISDTRFKKYIDYVNQYI